MKKCFMYFGILLGTITVLFIAYVLVAMIPNKLIDNHLKESADFYSKKFGIDNAHHGREFEFIYYYADATILNIIQHFDNEHPISSFLWANYYKEKDMDTNTDFVTSIKYQKDANKDYLRYWHGSILIIKPLLCLFNIKQIYTINQVLMWILAISLLVILFFKSKRAAIAYVIAMIMITFWIVPTCLVYSWMFYIMLIASIIAVQIEKRGDNGLYILFFMAGIFTCFLDFLTTEIITLCVPLLLVFFIRKEQNRLPSFKESMIFIIKACFLWGTAFILMFCAKWILAGIILDIHSLEYVKNQALLRINGTQDWVSKSEMYHEVIPNNIKTLLPMFYIAKYDAWPILFVIFAIFLALLDWHHIEKKKFSILMLLIGAVPYARYIILANHSYRHVFFTFRCQIITIMALLFIMRDCLRDSIRFSFLDGKEEKKVNKKGKKK